MTDPFSINSSSVCCCFFIEILNFVQIQQNAARRQQRPHIGKDFLNIRNRRRSGVKFIETFLCFGGDQVGQGGFPRARWTVKIILAAVPLSIMRRSRPLSPRRCFLPYHFIQTLRPDFIGQRTFHATRLPSSHSCSVPLVSPGNCKMSSPCRCAFADGVFRERTATVPPTAPLFLECIIAHFFRFASAFPLAFCRNL